MSERDELAALDAEARERALDVRRSILLQAPAGSGKTTVLTQRFLRLLAEVDEPEEILAITFTRKAAGEMRERVLRALRGDIDESTAHGRTMSALAAAARERARTLGWQLTENPARLRIQTIDALNRVLASHLPVAARAAGDLAVSERPTALYRLAARRTLADAELDPELEPDVERLFERLDNDFGRFERLLTAMLAARSHWLRHLLDQPEPGLRARVEASLRSIVEERLRTAVARLPQPLVAQGVRLARAAAVNRKDAGDASEGPWRVWLADPGGEPQALGLPHWRALASLALTEQGTWRAALTRREGFPPTDKALKAEAVAWLDRLARVPGARELLLELASLPEPRLAEDDALALESLARILKLAASELEIVFRETGRVDHPYIAAAARRALTEEGAPTDLGLRLGARIRHILVDEYQDTSIEQCELLEALTAGWEDGDGRTLFVVGDPMQSIYLFREAEVGLFLRTRECGLGGLRLEPLALTRNFRSLPAIVSWTNAAFPRVFPAVDDVRASAVKYLPSVATRTGAEGGLVRLHRTRPGDVQGEARAIARLVGELRAAEPGASIAVLVSARAHAEPIAAALEDAGIAVAGVDLVSLAELPVVRDLTALARALDHLGDRTAWLAVLRAPWCGMTLRELSTLLRGATHATVWEAIGDPERCARLAPDAQARLERVRGALEHALAEADRKDFARWVEATWLRLGGPAACAGDDDPEHAAAFFAALARWCGEPDWTGPASLEERLGELYADHATAPADAVQIMTIHRAKGLEFDKVIVPGLGRRLRASPEPLLRWLELPRDPDGSDLLMAPIPSSARRAEEPLNAYLKSLQARRVANERARLLYVAATRARSELHLFGELPEPDERRPAPEPPAGTLLATLWPAVAAEFPQEPEEHAGNALEPAAPATRRLVRLAASWTPPPVEPGPTIEGLPIHSYEADTEPEYPWPDEVARAVGCVVFEHLWRYSRQGVLPPARQVAGASRQIRERLARFGLTESELGAATEQTLGKLRRCVDDPRLKWLLAPRHRDIASPLELTGLYEGRLETVRIDRSFIDEEGVRWVVDFGRGFPRPGQAAAFLEGELARHRPRLEKHAAFARMLGPEPVRAALYLPAVPAFLEI